MLAGCSHRRSSSDEHSENIFTDDYGRNVAVPLSPTRIVSTSPAITEIVFALGAEDLLVGRTDFCTYPPATQHIESIGGISNLNVEKILSLKPDLVLSGSMIPKKSTLQMEKMGVPTVCIIEQQQFDGLYHNIAKIGSLIGRSSAADSLIRKIKLSASQILNRPKKEPPTVYYVVGFGPSGNFTAGGNSFINDIITMAGGQNLAAHITGWSYSLESLLQENPHYIVIRKEDSATFCNTAPYNKLKAVRENRVIGIESGTIDIQVPRNIEAITVIHQRISHQ